MCLEGICICIVGSEGMEGIDLNGLLYILPLHQKTTRREKVYRCMDGDSVWKVARENTRPLNYSTIQPYYTRKFLPGSFSFLYSSVPCA